MTYGHHYRRNLVLHYYRSGLGCKKLAQLTVPGAGRRDAPRSGAITRFRRGDYETRCQRPGGPRARPHSQRSRRLARRARAQRRGCTLYLDEMVEQLRDQFGTTYSIWSVCVARLLRRRRRAVTPPRPISVIAVVAPRRAETSRRDWSSSTTRTSRLPRRVATRLGDAHLEAFRARARALGRAWHGTQAVLAWLGVFTDAQELIEGATAPRRPPRRRARRPRRSWTTNTSGRVARVLASPPRVSRCGVPLRAPRPFPAASANARAASARTRRRGRRRGRRRRERRAPARRVPARLLVRLQPHRDGLQRGRATLARLGTAAPTSRRVDAGGGRRRRGTIAAPLRLAATPRRCSSTS